MATFDPRETGHDTGRLEHLRGHGRQDLDDLLRQADVAMYAAKRTGSGAMTYSPREDDHSRNRLALLSELRRAIAERQVVLHF